MCSISGSLGVLCGVVVASDHGSTLTSSGESSWSVSSGLTVGALWCSSECLCSESSGGGNLSPIGLSSVSVSSGTSGVSSSHGVSHSVTVDGHSLVWVGQELPLGASLVLLVVLMFAH